MAVSQLLAWDRDTSSIFCFSYTRSRSRDSVVQCGQASLRHTAAPAIDRAGQNVHLFGWWATSGNKALPDDLILSADIWATDESGRICCWKTNPFALARQGSNASAEVITRDRAIVTDYFDETGEIAPASLAVLEDDWYLVQS